MRRNRIYRLITILIALCVCFQNVQPVYAVQEEEEEEQTVAPAAEVLTDPVKAGEKLRKISEEQVIYALVYLTDQYEMKEQADIFSDSVCTLKSGELVEILDVAEDAGRNIWYRVQIYSENESMEGYIQREFLAFSDERMIDWESQNIQENLMRPSIMCFSCGIGDYPDVDSFPESYQTKLMAIKEKHPNWIFVKMDTNLDWNSVIEEESKFGRNLIHSKGALETWKNGMYDSVWANASPGIIQYYMDPRNFLEESTLFQFEQQTYNASYHTKESVQSILQNTFMSGNIEGTGETYRDKFFLIGREKQVSPILLAARVKQEQGTEGKSPLISGTYKGYESLYNYYNIGASGRTEKEVIENGLQKAREQNWNTRIASLEGGVNFLVSRYIRVGQDTLYLQKFDVVEGDNGKYWHQYMQNIKAPSSEGKMTYNSYKTAGVLGAPFVFKIPVYRNMPENACKQPEKIDKVTLKESEINDLQVDGTVKLTPLVNGKEADGIQWIFKSEDSEIATVSENGVVTAVAPGETQIICSKEKGTEARCTVTVIKGETVKAEIPELNEISYDPEQTLKNIELPAGWKWEDETTVPEAGENEYNASYCPDPEKYSELNTVIVLKVKKAVNPPYTIPTNLKGIYGEELRSVELPENFFWENGEEILSKWKEGKYPAQYNPDPENYETVENIQIPVYAECVNHRYGDWITEKAPTCQEQGIKKRVCSVCGKEEKMELNKVDHHYEDGKCKYCGQEEPKNPDKVTLDRTEIDSLKVDEKIRLTPLVNGENIDGVTWTFESTDSGVASVDEGLVTAVRPGTAVISCTKENGTKAECRVTVVKGDILKYTLPKLEKITYDPDSHLETISLPDGWKWKDGTAVPTVKVKNYDAVYCSDPERYNEITVPVPLEVEKGKISCSSEVIPSNLKGILGEKLNTVKLPRGFSWENGEEILSKWKENVYPARYNPDPENYETVTGIEITVFSECVNHQYGAWTTVKEPTCTENGVQEHTCAICGETERKTTPKKEHHYVNGKCEYCGVKEPEEVKPAEPKPAEPKPAEPKPVESKPVESKPAESKPAEQKKEEEKPAKPQNEIQNNIKPYKDAKKENAEKPEEKILDLTSTSVLYREHLEESQRKNQNLVLKMNEKASWSIDSESIARMPEQGIDMAVEVKSAESLKKDSKEFINVPVEDMILLTLAHEGDFGFDAVLDLSVGKHYCGRIANLYYCSPDGLPEFLEAVAVDGDGVAKFKFEHASEYVVAMAEKSLEEKNELTDEEEITYEESTGITEEETAAAGQEEKNITWGDAVLILIVIICLIVGGTGIAFALRKNSEYEE